MNITRKQPFGTSLNHARHTVKRDGAVSPAMGTEAFAFVRLLLSCHPQLMTMSMISAEVSAMNMGGHPSPRRYITEARDALAAIGLDLVTNPGRGWGTKPLARLEQPTPASEAVPA